MNEQPEQVEPPTQIRQWSAADMAKAKAAGRNDLITAAFESGQLDNVIASGDLAQPAGPSQSQQSTPMDHAAALAFTQAQEGQS